MNVDIKKLEKITDKIIDIFLEEKTTDEEIEIITKSLELSLKTQKLIFGKDAMTKMEEEENE